MMATVSYYYVDGKYLKQDGPRILAFMHSEQWQRRNMKTHGVGLHQSSFITRPMTSLEIEEEKVHWRMHAHIYKDAVALVRDEYKVSENPEFCAQLESALTQFKSLKGIEQLPLPADQRAWPVAEVNYILFDPNEV